MAPFREPLLTRKALLILAGMAMLVVIQLWVPLRYASFVVPLLVGIGGTLVSMAVMMSRTQQTN